MPGESIVLVSDRGQRIRSFVEALATFPAEPRWVLVGGFAVNVRIAEIHRLTADLDTVTANAPRLVELLVAGGASKQSAGDVLVTAASVDVEVGVMGGDDERSGAPGDREFALARRLALKAVSLPRRPTSAHPEKVLSDALDLVRLVAGRDVDALAASLRSIEPELRAWTSQTLSKWFAAGPGRQVHGGPPPAVPNCSRRRGARRRAGHRATRPVTSATERGRHPLPSTSATRSLMEASETAHNPTCPHWDASVRS